jgi:ABC-type Na+ efflux pump permease subunit
VNPRKLLRIARWEVARGAGGVSRETVAVALVTVAFVGLVVPTALSAGVAIDEGIYRVGVAPESPYYEPVAQDPTFAVREPDREALGSGIDLLIRDGRFVPADTEKGGAALAELRGTVEGYNDARLSELPDESAAFPVEVSLRYVEPAADSAAPGAPGTGGGGGGSDAAGGGGGDGTGGTGDGGDGDGVPTPAGGGSGLSAPGASGGLFDPVSDGTPSGITPPFPFQSLVLAFVFVLPLNFVIQAYGSSMLKERLNRRGELLLVAPVTRGEVIAGKTLPYFAGAVGVAAAIVTVLSVTVGDAGPVSVLAVVPLALLFLAATFLGAMMARSFKELTFVTVTVSVLLTSFAFVPAVFTNTDAIALISPLTLVVRDLGGEALGLGEIAFATLPATLTGLALFGLGAGLYREEDLFTQRPVHLKFLDALAGRVHRLRSLPLVVALLLPFVFVAELAVVATLFAVGRTFPTATLVALLVAISLIEEAAKSLPVYAGYAHARYERTLRTGVIAGALAGLGFFLAEKGLLVAQVVGFGDIPLGQATLSTAGAPVGGALALALLLAPLALHTVTAGLSAVGGVYGPRGYAVGYLAAVVVHVLYNLTVVMTLV